MKHSFLLKVSVSFVLALAILLSVIFSLQSYQEQSEVTKEEIEELIINCSRTWITSYNGVNGYRMTGPNGNSIFLPAAGRHYNERHIGESNGYYWSATSGGLYWAEHINFYPDNEFPIYSSYRNYGQPIRPVSN